VQVKRISGRFPGKLHQPVSGPTLTGDIYLGRCAAGGYIGVNLWWGAAEVHVSTSRHGAIIAIHGVGAPRLGEVITDLSTLFPSAVYARNDVVITGETFARLEAERSEHPDLLEVNWSDVKRPPKSLFGIVEWTIALSIALAHADLSWSTVRLRTPRANAFLVEAVLLWIVYPVLLGFMHANLRSQALAVADAAVFGMAVLTYWMARRATKLAAAAGRVTAMLLLVLIAILWGWPEWATFLNPIAVRAYGLAQMGAAALITVTALEISIRVLRREITGPGATARLALTYLPLAMLSALGSCVWAVSLNIVFRLRQWDNINSKLPDKIDPQWQKMFSRHLGYDLKSVEWAMAGATFALGCFAIWAILNYRMTSPTRKGQAAHRAIWHLTLLAPVCLSIPGLLLALTTPYLGNLWHVNRTQDVLQVYTVSAMRILPWLVASVTGITALLDVLSDIVFYITDRKSGLSSFDVCNSRLSLLLKSAEVTYDWVHVVAHSQGSVIAHTTLAGLKSSLPTALTTMGSPLGPLYGRYLAWPITRPLEDWQNLFRSGDYIGGPIGMPDVDKDIGVGEHTGYWTDVRTGERLRRDITAPRT